MEATDAARVPLATSDGRRHELSAVEFAALFDGLDWTRVQVVRRIPTPISAA